ncbi:hypothetical protein [Aestuariimicrobium sp. T2.26MG-19.2B]|uniref:hypothetical protein n=1 Tax=Aestuariimicrobium sp. T2.26MG-19.2B TaxID=3040679 RepID=UPI00253FBF12|nr:hypothetical protein [Aestuariimicrobium sp. T2.26MG-19.2B]
MTKNLLMPHLPDGPARELLHQYRNDGGSLRDRVQYGHRRAVPVATGGTRATPDDIRELRDRVMADVGDLLGPHRVRHSELDATLGRSLVDHLPCSDSQAAQRYMWQFLTVVVFPDVLKVRFPDLPDDRGLGKPFRNLLWRAYGREILLGPFIHGQEAPLGEDELVQLAERSALARIPHVAQACAEVILEQRLPNRPDSFTRPLMKYVGRLTGPRDLGVLSQGRVKQLIRQQARRVLDEM